MKRVRCIFVSPSGLFHEIIGEVVRFATDSKWSHCAIGLEIDGKDSLVEAVFPKVRIGEFTFYDNEKDKEYIDISVTDEQLVLMVQEAKKIYDLGYWYGLNDCLAGGVTDVIGIPEGKEIAELICHHLRTTDCSELYVRIIRAAFPDFLKGLDSNCVTPERAYEATKEYFKIA